MADILIGAWHYLSRLLAVPLLVLLAQPALADTGRRVALVIGNGAYQNAPNLPNPPNDAKAVARTLRGLDFEVIEAVNLDQGKTLAKLSDFAGKMEGADLGLFYFAGHAMQLAGDNYLLPIDARLRRRTEVPYQTVRLQTILDSMEGAVQTRILLLDACRNNPLAQRLAQSMSASRSLRPGEGLAPTQTASGTIIAFATAPGQIADDGDGSHSPFTQGLLQHLATPRLEIRQILTRVRKSVVELTNGSQVPWDSSSLVDELYLTNYPDAKLSGRQESKTPPTYDGQDGLVFAAIRDSRRATDFEAFILQFPDSPFRKYAQDRLDELSSDKASLLPAPPSSRPVKPLPEVLEALGPVQRAGAPTQNVAAAQVDLTRRAQKALADLGYEIADVDGQLGPSTRRAISDWLQGSITPEHTAVDERLVASLQETQVESLQAHSQPASVLSADQVAGMIGAGRESSVAYSADDLAAVLAPIEAGSVAATRALKGGGDPKPGARASGVVPDLRINFAVNSAKISPAARVQLDELGRALQFPRMRQLEFVIAGHTDAAGSAEMNKRLSERRAEAVVSYLIEGYAIAPERLQAEGWGEGNLLDPAKPNSAMNRRVEVRVQQ